MIATHAFTLPISVSFALNLIEKSSFEYQNPLKMMFDYHNLFKSLIAC